MRSGTEPPGKPTFVAYVDESGDEGFRFGLGSSEWFVLAAVIFRKSRELQTVKLVDRVRARLGRDPRKPLHFRDLKHEQRLPLIDEISRAPMRAIVVFIHKPTIREPCRFQERYRLYSHGTRYLLERVSWFCRDQEDRADAGDGSAEIVFSNRSGMSYEEMRAYFEHLRNRSDPPGASVDWSVLRSERIVAYGPGRRMGLPIVDAVASGFFHAVEPSRYGFTEDRHARMCKPLVHHHRRDYLGYGRSSGLARWRDGYCVRSGSPG